MSTSSPMASLTTNCCDECGLRFFIHNVRHLNRLRRFCTGCVLRTFPESFCAMCFNMFESPPQATERSTCLNCEKKSDWFEIGEGGGGGVEMDEVRRLHAAARIAAESMRKAAKEAREEAEKRVREALKAKRKAEEAMWIFSSVFCDDYDEIEKIEKKRIKRNFVEEESGNVDRDDGKQIGGRVKWENVESERAASWYEEFGIGGGGVDVKAAGTGRLYAETAESMKKVEAARAEVERKAGEVLVARSIAKEALSNHFSVKENVNGSLNSSKRQEHWF